MGRVPILLFSALWLAAWINVVANGSANAACGENTTLQTVQVILSYTLIGAAALCLALALRFFIVQRGIGWWGAAFGASVIIFVVKLALAVVCQPNALGLASI
jgi:hypothetical protein